MSFLCGIFSIRFLLFFHCLFDRLKELIIRLERCDLRMIFLDLLRAAEQKARSTYDNILRVVTDPDVCEPIRFLRKREIVHFQRFGEALRGLQEKLDSRNFYAFNPSFDPLPAAAGNSR